MDARSANHPLGSSAATAELPYGRRLLPTLIDHIATIDPDRPFVLVPKDDNDLSKGYSPISYLTACRAIDRMAYFLKPHLDSLNLKPPSTELLQRWTKAPVVAFLGISDLRHQFFVIAAAKLSVYPMFLCDQHSLPGHLNQLDAAKCVALVHTEGVEHIVTQIAAKHHLHQVQVPTLQELLATSSVKDQRYLYTRTFDQAHDDVFVIVATSGSTGLPKSTPVPVQRLSLIDFTYTLPNDPQTGSLPWHSIYAHGIRRLMPFPPYHAAGTLAWFIWTVLRNSVQVEVPVSRPVDMELVCEVIEHGEVECAAIQPWLCKALASSEHGKRVVSRLTRLSCTGGPLDPEAGKILSQRTHVFNAFSSTEYSFIQYVCPPEDWQYYHFARENGIDWQLVNPEQQLYEPVLVRRPEFTDYQAAFFNKPKDLIRIHTGDLFSPHPTKSWLWRSAGRKDDVITYGTGHSYLPVGFERVVESHPKVRSAIMAGDGRTDSILHVELEDPESAATDSDRQAMLEEVYPSVEKAFAEKGSKPITKVEPSHVIFATPEKPFPRTVKGNVSRKKALELFKEEVERLDEQ